MNNLVNVNGTVGLLLTSDENVFSVQYGFGIVEHKKSDDLLVDYVDGDIPSYLSVSHDDVVSYVQKSKKRSGPSKMELCQQLFDDMIGVDGIDMLNGDIRPVDIKNEMMDKYEISEKMSSTYYYKCKKNSEEVLGFSLTAPKKVKESVEVSEDDESSEG